MKLFSRNAKRYEKKDNEHDGDEPSAGQGKRTKHADDKKEKKSKKAKK